MLDKPVPESRVVIDAAATELMELSALADQIGSSDADPVRRLQPLDRLSQHLAGLALFLRSVAQDTQIPPAVLARALELVRIGALDERLRCLEHSVTAETGAVELF